MVFAIIAFLLAGCADRKPKDAVAYMPADIKAPPRYPKAVNVPIDPALQASAVKEIESALHSSDEIIRGHAIETLKDSKLPQAEPAILAALGDRSRFVRKSAAFAAGELKLQSALGHLDPLLHAGDGAAPQEAMYALQERMAAIYAMHRLGVYTYSHEFEKTATDTRFPIRADTAFILGMLGEKSAIPILSQMLHNDTDVNVKLQAAEALWKLGEESGENALVEATVSNYASDVMIAVLALAEPRDTRLLGQIEGLYHADYPQEDLVCARAAGMLGSDSGYGFAMKGEESEDPRQRALAAMAFGDIGRTDAQPRLAKLLKDNDPDVRLAAAGAIVEIAEKAR
jgi:HEAT repeat protein